MSDLLLSRWVRGEAEERGITRLRQRDLEPAEADHEAAVRRPRRSSSSSSSRPTSRRSRRATEIELQMLERRDPEAGAARRTRASRTPTIERLLRGQQGPVLQPRRRATCARSSTRTRQRSSRPRPCWRRTTPRRTGRRSRRSTRPTRRPRTAAACARASPRARAILPSRPQIFSAPQGQLVGPFKAQAGFYVIEVEKITPASTTPLSKASAQIKQQLAQGSSRRSRQNFQQDFVDKWTVADLLRRRLRDRPLRELHRHAHQPTPGAPPVTSTPPSARARDRVPRAAGPGSAAGADSAAAAPAAQPGVIGPGGQRLPPGRRAADAPAPAPAPGG